MQIYDKKMKKARGARRQGLRNEIRQMEVGDVRTYPIERYMTVKQYAYEMGILEYPRRIYRSHIMHDNGDYVTIIRVE